MNMNLPFPQPQPNPRKLHSPLLDGNKKENNLKGKRTYYNPFEENKISNTVDETLDKNLFGNSGKGGGKEKKEVLLFPKEINSINQKFIDSLEVSLKVANIFICATGGILSILELTNIIRTISSGSFNFESSLLVFIVAFIGTILSSVVCHGFIHLIKTTKYIYLNIENRRSRLLQ